MTRLPVLDVDGTKIADEKAPMGELVTKLTGKLEGWLEALVLLAPNILGAVLVLLLFWGLGTLVGKGIHRVMARVSTHKALNELFESMVRFGVRVAGLLVALDIIELEKAATSFLGGAGIFGLALGFAFQDLTANFISGIAMAVKRPLRVGDLIETNEHFGTVEAVEMRSTRLRTLQGQSVIIPNRKIYENALVNFSAQKERRIDLVVGVSYGDDLANAQRVTVEAAKSVEAATGDVHAFFTGFGGSSIDMVVQIWIKVDKQLGFLAARSDAIMAIKSAFDAADITIPFPIRTLDFGIVGGERLRDHLSPPPARDAA